jgi:hypothetical protein
MPGWECGIGGCGRTFGDPEAALVHQVTEHEHHECRVCGAVVPEGFFAIKHAFEEHTRTDFLRHYDGSADDIRDRERVKSDIEERVDVERLRERLAESGAATARAD